MSKFKAGDKVVWRPFGTTLERVKIFEVEFVDMAGYIKLKDTDGRYSQDYFTSYEVPPFKNMKFKVNSPEHSKEIQEALFEMGYKWWGQSTVLNFVDNPFLYSEDTGIIAIGQSQDFFERLDTHQEYLVETTKSYKLIPVESPKEIITIDGKTYDKEAVLKRLAELEEVDNA